MADIQWPRLDGAADPLLQRAMERLDSAGELELDFAAVPRIDAPVLRAMEQLASKASEKSAKVVLCGLNVPAYKVLKLARMSGQFSFQS